MTIAAGARRFAGRVYRRSAAPFGIRALDRMLRDGLPGRFDAPIRFLFTNELRPEGVAVRARVERRRRAIAGMRETYGFTYTTTTHGPTRWLVRESSAPTHASITSGRLAYSAAVPERWGVFLYLCADVSAAGSMIEIGSSTGISAAYLASGRGCRHLITLEGSPALAPVAQATLDELAPRGLVIQGAFDEGLDCAFELLDNTNTGIDLAFLAVTTARRPRCITCSDSFQLRPGALLILDDIYLYADMWRAWNRIRMISGMSLSVILGRFALLTWND